MDAVFLLVHLSLVGGALAAQPLSQSSGSKQPIVFLFGARGSRMVMHTFTEGALSVFAPDFAYLFTSFSGRVELLPGMTVPASFLVRIDTDSISLLGNVDDADRKSIEQMVREDILDTRTYPVMIYRSTNISVTRDSANQVRLEGTLTQHGVTRPCPIAVTVTLTDAALRMRGAFSIRQSDYGMLPKTFALGTVRVKDQVDISFDLVARRE